MLILFGFDCIVCLGFVWYLWFAVFAGLPRGCSFVSVLCYCCFCDLLTDLCMLVWGAISGSTDGLGWVCMV